VIPSHEVSDVISEISSTVTDFKPGDEVCGLIRFDRDGAAAEFVTVPAADLAAKPSTVSHVAAAALPLPDSPRCRRWSTTPRSDPGRRSWCTAGRAEWVR
jgi:NADPH:quinone reductase-like Zn-dependent oxidoreductase